MSIIKQKMDKSKAFAKELNWRINKQNLKQIPTKLTTKPQKNTRGTNTEYYITIGPTTQIKASSYLRILDNAVKFAQTTQEDIQTYLQLFTQQHEQQYEQEHEQHEQHIKNLIEESDRELRELQQEYTERIQQRLKKDKLLAALLAAHHLIPHIHNHKHFEPPKYYGHQTTKEETHILLTTNNLISPNTKPATLWTSRHTMRNILKAPTPTTLYTSWPNILYYQNKYYIFLTKQQLVKTDNIKIPKTDLHKIQQ